MVGGKRSSVNTGHDCNRHSFEKLTSTIRVHLTFEVLQNASTVRIYHNHLVYVHKHENLDNKMRTRNFHLVKCSVRSDRHNVQVFCFCGLSRYHVSISTISGTFGRKSRVRAPIARQRLSQRVSGINRGPKKSASHSQLVIFSCCEKHEAASVAHRV